MVPLSPSQMKRLLLLLFVCFLVGNMKGRKRKGQNVYLKNHGSTRMFLLFNCLVFFFIHKFNTIFWLVCLL